MKSISKILDYRKTHTLAETGKKFNLTSERVRQIEHLKNRKRCEKHNRFYYNSCSHCLSEKYRLYIKWLPKAELLKEVSKEAKNRKRDYLSTMRKAYLIEILFNPFLYSYSDIAKLLARDYSTIANLVKKLNHE